DVSLITVRLVGLAITRPAFGTTTGTADTYGSTDSHYLHLRLNMVLERMERILRRTQHPLCLYKLYPLTFFQCAM
ncbi:unnamed protein product, partial [Callosobruchus maculatus]